MDKFNQGTSTRKMVHSQSAFNVFDSESPNNDQFRRSSSLESMTLTHENLRHACELFLKYLCCPRCSGVERKLESVEGAKDVFFCAQCNIVVGLDDTMNYYDLLVGLSGGQYQVDPCSTCGNMDPDFFEIGVITEGAGCGDNIERYVMKCLKCTQINGESQHVSTTADRGDLRDGDLTESVPIVCRCGNGSIELFDITFRDYGDVKCLICDHEFRLPLTRCICQSGGDHEVIFDEYGYSIKIICRQCRAEVDCGARKSTPRSSSKGLPKGRTQVKTLALLKRGDHVAWHQKYAYWHHAIVTNVDEARSIVSVINYDGPSHDKGKIVAQDKYVNPTAEQFYRIDYADLDCYHPDDVVSRAMSRLGETRYHLLNNNCEHFARWSKTGHELSLQRESFIRKSSNWIINGMSGLAASARTSGFTAKLGADVIHNVNDEIGTTVAKCVETAAFTAENVTERELFDTASTALPPSHHITLSVMIVSNIGRALNGIHKARKLRQEGNISREEFIKITINKVAVGVGCLGGVGIALAIPFTRNCVGMTLGNIIGNSVGGFVGRQLGVAYDYSTGAK